MKYKKQFYFGSAITVSLLLAASCRTSSKQQASDMQNANDPMYPKAAKVLNIIGAAVTDPDYVQQGTKKCALSCHQHGTEVTENYIKKWGETTQKLYSCLKQSDDAAYRKKCLKDPDNPDAYSVKTLGFARGAVGSPYFEDIFKQLNPDGATFKKEYLTFVTAVQMPPFKFGNDNPEKSIDKVEFRPPYFGQDAMITDPHELPFTEDEYKSVIDWVMGEGDFEGKPMAYRTELMKLRAGSQDMPKACKDDISPELVNHIKNMNSYGWTRKHLIDRQTPMHGCEKNTPVSQLLDNDNFDVNTWALGCLSDYKKAATEEYAKGWAEAYMPNGRVLPQNLRILRHLKSYNTTYWIRSSADGRYIGNGLSRGGTPNEAEGEIIENGAKGFVYDLNEKAWNRIIGVSGPYDPGFFPDNRGLTWMDPTGVFCNQEVLSKEVLKDTSINDKPFINFKTSPYCTTTDMRVYQHASAQLDENIGVGTYYVVRGNFANDDTSVNTSGSIQIDPKTDPFTRADSKLEIYHMKNKASNGVVDKGFNIDKPVQVNTPYEGDYGISPSSIVVTSRFATVNAQTSTAEQLGYRLSTVDFKKLKAEDPVGNAVHKKVVGEICLKGAKVSMSYNERFMITHHVTDSSEEDRLDLRYAAKGTPAPAGFPDRTYENFQKVVGRSSNIYMVDLLTKKKYRLTNMKANQFATYPHFRADGWIYFLVRDLNTKDDYFVASDAALMIMANQPIEKL